MVQGLDHTDGHLNSSLFLFKFVTGNRNATIVKGSYKNIELCRDRSLYLMSTNG